MWGKSIIADLIRLIDNSIVWRTFGAPYRKLSGGGRFCIVEWQGGLELSGGGGEWSCVRGVHGNLVFDASSLRCRDGSVTE